MITSVLNTIIAAAQCPGIQELVILVALALSLVVGLKNSRKIQRISETAALRDHLKKRK